jgi:hypothetical protein
MSDPPRQVMKCCRWCGEEIKPTALICKHCRSWQREDADKEALVFDKSFVRWGKVYLVVGGVVVAAFAAVFGFDLNKAREEASKSQTDARSSQLDAKSFATEAKVTAEQAKTSASQTYLDAGKLYEETKAKIADIDAQVSKEKTKLESDIGKAEKDVETLAARIATLTNGFPSGDSLVNQSSAITSLQQQVTQLQTTLSSQTPVVASNSADLAKTIEVKQTAVQVDGTVAGEHARSFDVTFSVCSSVNDICGLDHLKDISRVVYRLDPRWFSVKDVPIVTRENGFQYRLRVWGSTRVRACIFLNGEPGRPVVRSGMIKFADEPSYWAADTAVDPADCVNLNGV